MLQVLVVVDERQKMCLKSAVFVFNDPYVVGQISRRSGRRDERSIFWLVVGLAAGSRFGRENPLFRGSNVTRHEALEKRLADK